MRTTTRPLTGAGSSLNLQLSPGTDGAYRFEGLPEGEARIEVKLRGKGTIVMGRTEVTARLASGQTVVRDLQVMTEP